MIDHHQRRLLEAALSGLLISPDINGNRIEALRGLNWIGRKDVRYVSQYMKSGLTVGFDENGARALRTFALSLRLKNTAIKRAIDGSDFVQLVAKLSKMQFRPITLNISVG